MNKNLETSKERSKVILVIEDEIPLIKAIMRKIEDSGLEAISARTAKQALDLIEELEIDGIWLDHYLLGEKDGLEFLAELKEKRKDLNIPIFVVSNTASDQKVSTYIAFGIEKYYIKSDYKLSEIVNDIIEKTLDKK
jgi:response regulator RpfG family c-di-GMP phosphodiesterase